MIKIIFGCGHQDSYSDQMQVSPRCHCGNTTIVQVRTSRPPRFTGACSGPYAEYRPVDPGIVNVATAGPLAIKEQTHGK